MAVRKNEHGRKKSNSRNIVGSREWYRNLQIGGGTGSKEFKEWAIAIHGSGEAWVNKVPKQQKQDATGDGCTDDPRQLSFDDYLNLPQDLPS